MPKLMQYASGSVIFLAGDKDEIIYILQSGQIILKNIDLETRTETQEKLSPGQFFGVKSALAKMPRIVTAVASKDSQVVLLTVPEFERIFSSKRNVIEKMLRVFSKNLRDIHKRTEAILEKDSEKTPAERGMFCVAQAFYNDEEYRSCCDILTRILEQHGESENREEVEKFFKDAKVKAVQQEYETQKKLETSEIDSKSSENSLNQFSLPVFDRFTKKYSKGSVIISEFEPGEKFYLIKSGKVQIIKTMNGQNKALDVLNPGEFFGEMAILDNSPRTATCVAKTETACLEFSKENFSTLVLGNSQIAMNLLKLFCKRICDQRRRFKIILIKDLQVRIADIFLMYEEIYDSKMTIDLEKNSRKIYITLGDIASWAGISQNQARDELDKMINRNKIQMFSDYILVENIHDMRRLTDSYYKKLAASGEVDLQGQA